ncbi:MAG TPA: vWA domain-containing protein, partial [Longimicrobiaceae bacterium]|nr:vWA domain-containing protein [Longimicrobiaceae bacterium]
FPPPDGNTAIGDAMEAARRDLYAAGIIRKYILVVTDGENTAGRPADKVVAEIARRSEQSVRIYYIAFDVGAENFTFVRDAGGDVLSARGGPQLREALAEVYRGRILAEQEDYGDAFPQSAGGAAADENAKRSVQP